MRFWSTLAAAVAGLLMPVAAQAAITINVVEVGANVVATGSGSFTSPGVPNGGLANYSITINASRGAVLVGAQIPTNRYYILTPVRTFGTQSSFYFPVASAGDAFGVYGQDGALFLPAGYVSGQSLSGSATYGNQTLASMGLSVGTYVFSSGTDTVTINIGANAGAVPEPVSWAMMIVGMGMVGFAVRRAVRRSEAVFDEKIKRIAAGLEA